MGDDRRRPGGGEQLCQAAGRVGWIERQVGAARLEDAEQRDRQVDRTLGEDGDHRLRPDAQAAQVAGQGSRAAVDLGVGERAAAADDRGGAGGRRRLRCELPIDGVLAAHLGGGFPLPGELLHGLAI